jgi:hypothetical protein
MNKLLKWLKQGLALASVIVISTLIHPSAHAQPQLIGISGASVFEGQSGTSVMRFPIHFFIPFSRTPTANLNTVTGQISAVPLTGANFIPATGGTACGPGIDFVQFSNVPITVAANTPIGQVAIEVTVCGDQVVEPNESIFVSFSNAVGADCADGCGAIGVIRNDDGPPSISIFNQSTSEPIIGSRLTPVKVSLSHASPQPVSVNYATRDGTARGRCLTCFTWDYEPASGTLTIPPGALSGTISVGIVSDSAQEGIEDFFVDLSNPVDATILLATSRVIIQNTPPLSIGGFDLSTDNARVSAGMPIPYAVTWTVPDNLVWRNLKTIDMRLRGGHGTALWVRWDESSNLFSLCEKQRNGRKDDEDGDDDDDDDDRSPARANLARPTVVCSAGALPGSNAVLSTRYASLHLASTSVQGSGPAGQAVTLNLALTMAGKSAGHKYKLELAATDDFGNEDRFVRASELQVLKLGQRSSEGLH